MLPEEIQEETKPVKHSYRIPSSVVKHYGRGLHIILLICFSLMFAGTAYAGYEAYNTTSVELSLYNPRIIDLTDSTEEFEEPGFSAKYCVFGRCHDLSGRVAVENPDAEKIKDRVIGNYQITYRLDYGGDILTDTREIIIQDTVPPELTLNSPESIGLYVGETFEDPGFTAFDNHDGDLTESVQVDGSVDASRLGVYTLTYSATDAAGNITEKSRKVFVYNYSALSSEPIATFDDLKDYVERTGLDVSFGFKNLDTGFTYTLNPDRLYYGASLSKTLDALYVYEKFGGPRDWNESFLLQNAISFSNNSAHVTLAGGLGLANLRAYAQSIGMQHHLQGSKFVSGTNAFCDTTVADQLAEWSHLWELINSLDNGSDLARLFLNGAYATMNFYGVPPMAFKAGFYGGTHHESAIFYTDSPYIFTVLTMNGYRPDREIRMRDLSERVFLLNQTL